MGQTHDDYEAEDDDYDGEAEDDDYDEDDTPAPWLRYETAGPPRQLSFEFTGNTREYFRIWVVNTCLSLFTLGIFSAWAKVRKKRYLYSHTRLDGTPFQYLGRPIPILKGRLIAVVLASAWYMISHFSPESSLLLLIIGVVVGPWIIVRSAAFNARYSAYRNITFHFGGSYGGFLGTLVGNGFLAGITCGLGYAWLRAKLTAYLVSRTHFGGVAGRFVLEGKHFLPAYVTAWLGAAIVGATVRIFVHSGFDLHGIQLTLYFAYGVYFIAYVFLKARITNLVWRGTRLGGVSFECTLSFWRLLWIYLSNSLAIIGTLGLLTPWATMRALKYRARCFAVYSSSDLREFSGRNLTAVRAAGAELGELFDLDLAL